MFQKPSLKSPQVSYSRSKELSSTFHHRLQDKTLYNSANYNVFLYKNAPNRGPTPIKAPTNKSTGGFLSPEKTEEVKMLTRIAKSYSNIPFPKRKELINEGSRAPIRLQTTLPQMTTSKVRKIPFILNDFHIRETNSGFARNDLGGFFTR
jgi:hypothetical protein